MFFKNKVNIDQKELNTDISRLFLSQEIIKRVAKVRNIEEICKITLDEIENKMGYSSASISIYDKDTNTIQLKYISNSTLSKLLRKIVLSNESFKPLVIGSENITLTMEAVIENKVIVDDNIAKFVVPPLSKALAAIVQTFPNAKSMIALPIKNREGVFGVLNFTLPKYSNEVSKNEKRTLELFTDQIGLIIDNSLKYSEISNFNIILKDKINNATADLRKQNKDLQSLYTLTSNISKSLDVDVVSQTAVNSLPQDTSMIGAILNLFDEEKQELYVKAVTSNQTSYAVEKIIGNIKQYKIDINDRQFDENISRKAFVMDKIYSSTNLADFISPPVPKSMVPAIEKLLKISSVVLYPLKRRDKVIGTIAYFLTKEDYAQLPQNEKNLYATYTAQIASALENSFLLKNLEEARAKIEEAYKKEKDMMDILGHELRTPLTVARNAVLMIDMEFQKPQPDMSAVNDLLEKAKENIKREISTLQTVLSTTRLENDRAQINYVKVDAKDVVHDSIEALGGEAEKKKLQIKTELPEKEIFAWAGREQIQEIMDNLLSNAIKYTEKGEITISIIEDGDYVSFIVRDTGEGIPENEIKNLGKKFHRVNPYVQSNGVEYDINIVRPGGTGIGLYVVKGFLEKMGGKFGVESKLGEGSVFTASLQKYSGQDLSVKTDKNT